MIMVPANAAQVAALLALTEADADLDGALIHLYSNDYTPTPQSAIGDFDEADYTGYATEEITWQAPSMSDDGHPEANGIAGEFRPTGTTITNNVYGIYITTAGGALRFSGRFDDAPLPMLGTTDQITVTPRLRLDPYGGPVVVVS